jgi:hypothetical protein
MKEQTKVKAGLLVAGILNLDGLMHVYWATGSLWPASDPKSLALAVLNVEVSFGPQVVLPIAATLFSGAVIILARINRLGKAGHGGFPAPFLQFGTLAIATGVGLRSIAGLAWAFGLGADPKTPFYWLNLLVYTPLCLVLFMGTIAVARTAPRIEKPRIANLQNHSQ